MTRMGAWGFAVGVAIASFIGFALARAAPHFNPGPARGHFVR
jgi:hypothetical protein